MKPTTRGVPDSVWDQYVPTPAPTREAVAGEQIAAAMADLERHPSTFVHWPFADLDALTGPLAPGNVWFVCASSGGGKTTFVASAIDLWRQDGKRIYVMPLETRPKEFRTYLACMSLGLHPGEILSGLGQRLPNWTDVRERLKSELMGQLRRPYVDRVVISGQRAINIKGLEAGLREAKEFGAHVVIIDHIDHIDGGDGSQPYAEAQRVNNAAMQMAQDNEMLILFTSQLNMSASKGDYLAKYLPPKDEHVAFGSLKRRNATGMIGLFRPFRTRRNDETEKEHVASIRAARTGTGDVTGALASNTMGVSAMKLRNYGSREGAKAFLAVRLGRVYPLEERDRWSTDGGSAREFAR